MEEKQLSSLTPDELIARGKPLKQTSSLEVEYIPSPFAINTFQTTINEEVIEFCAMKMKDCLFLWIGKASNREFNDLSIGLIDKLTTKPITSKIVGPALNTTSLNIANKLTQKLGKPVYVSCNLYLDLLSLPLIEKCIHEKLQSEEGIF